MDFEQQKPITDEYRENWERMFGAKPGQTHVISGDWEKMRKPRTYPNGCPILEDSCRTEARPKRDTSMPTEPSSKNKA